MTTTPAPTPSADNAVDLTDVSKIYGKKVHALRGISMRVKRGEIPGGLEKKIMAMVFMDPSLRTRASFEAAVLWIQLTRPDLATSRIERSKSLLQSPVIADADKASIKSRMK